jgi:hypothetical protein
MQTNDLPKTGTSHTHEFLPSGCRNQWVHDHDFADCWKAFMRHQGMPETTTMSEFYGS